MKAARFVQAVLPAKKSGRGEVESKFIGDTFPCLLGAVFISTSFSFFIYLFDIIMKILFNPFYHLRHDLKRTYILGKEFPNGKEVNPGWISKIHPLFAMVFALLSEPVTVEEGIGRISYFLDIPEEEAKAFLSKFLNADEPFGIEYKGVQSQFPKNIIIPESEANGEIIDYTPEQFVYIEIDLEQERFFTVPLGIVFMVNNTCATDCVYCYADKQTRTSLLPFEKVKETIEAARRLNVDKFDVVGGEFFLYKEWEKLLDVLIANNYKPTLISTKIPLTEETIARYKKYDIPLQFSLDSLEEDALSRILHVKNGYGEKIKKTIASVEKYAIRFQISTVLTRYNNQISHLEKMRSFLSPFKHLVRWEIRVGFKSLYSKKGFDEIKIGAKEAALIGEWIKKIEKNCPIPILWSENQDKYFKSSGGSSNFVGSRCSANYSHMVLLPDGQVTICEQLYWKERFLIGDIRKNSISEIWNSPKALKLAFPQKADFRPTSACSGCEIFDQCMKFPNRCIADILKGYGEENADYPDPRCDKAPAFIYPLI